MKLLSNDFVGKPLLKPYKSWCTCGCKRLFWRVDFVCVARTSRSVAIMSSLSKKLSASSSVKTTSSSLTKNSSSSMAKSGASGMSKNSLSLSIKNPSTVKTKKAKRENNSRKSVRCTVKVDNLKDGDQLDDMIRNDQSRRLANRMHNSYDENLEILKRGYIVLKLIGSGSYAHVLRGRQKSTCKEVAIKLVELDESSSSSYKNNLLCNEIKNMKQTKHNNVVAFVDAFSIPATQILIMEFMPNGTFANHLNRNGAYKEQFAQTIFADITAGLRHLHWLSIAHRDIKLENLLLNSEGVGKISDFTFSLKWDRSQLITQFCGTPAYMPPEVLQK